jgi:outer membrane protein OmpA-like peptidoglycan-associated protein
MKHLLLIALLFSMTRLFAQKDMEGCNDHPLFKRIPNTYITLCSSGNDAIEMPLTDTTSEMVNGNRFFAQYSYHSAAGTSAPKFREIVNDYESVVAKLNGRKIYSDESAGVATFLALQKGKEMWIQLNDYSTTAPGNYQIIIVEADPARKKITGLTMLDDLSTKGFTTVNFKFENDKSIIDADSKKYIDIIADLMQNETDLNLSIESHTNSGGSPGENQRISDSRALSIYDALILKGVDKNRLKHKGWGATKPKFDNSSDKNDRVELIKN